MVHIASFTVSITYPSIPSHHLHQMLLYSLQHQLPTRSVLHHDDHSDLPHSVELHCSGKERRNKASQMHIRRENSLKLNMEKRSE